MAVAAIKGEKTLAELAQRFDVHTNQITQWRSQRLEGAAAVFGAGAKAGAAPAVDVKVLHAKIGELTLVNDFQEGALGKAGLPASAITYAPMARGYVYLVAIIDWFCRKVLAARLSITLSADFCVEALEEALVRHGEPEIFNTDQGSEFTSTAFTKVLKTAEIAISMDGKGAWRGDVFVARLWRTSNSGAPRMVFR